MKKSVLSMLAVAALVFGMTSCNGAKKTSEEAEKTEEAAVIAGKAPKDLLTEELKQETIQLLKDMPDSDIPYRLSTGEVKVNVGDIKYMVPVGKAAELSTPTQKARALGMYMADYNVLKAIGKPTAEVEGVIAKLATDLNVSFVLDILKEQKASRYSGGIYHKTQIDLTYNSNHMEGSRLTHDQTRYIFETNTIGVEKEVLNVDDVIETANHFRCIDMIIDHAKAALTEKFIKELHLVLKNGTSDSRKDWFAVGNYKKLPNEVGGRDTALPEEVADKMKVLLTEYNAKEEKNFADILDFHVKFERIHPFQDGNGRVGRLIMFKECLKYNIVPFIIEDNLKMFYYRGLKEWDNEKGYLTDTCLTAQDKYKAYLDYFRIMY